MSRFSAQAKALCYRAPNARDIEAGLECSRGPVDQDERMVSDAGAERLATFTVITVPVADLPSLARHSTLTVKGERVADDADYLVRDIRLMVDGELKELVCAEA